MVFSSLIFLFAFLPTVLFLYYLAPRSSKNAVLFVVSLFFYSWGEPVYMVLMMASITSAYGFGFLISRYRECEPKRAKLFAILSAAVNLSTLFFFKYYNFVASVAGIPKLVGLALPIGISFYTFQILSYTIDLYRGEIELQRNYLAFSTYVTLFPQLVAGPIVKYAEIDHQLTQRSADMSDLAQGIRRFSCGLAKKLLIGDALAAGYEYYKSVLSVQPTVLGAWMVAILYSMHLYYDFSGYSDMAIGLGRMFGFSFPENFNYPYISQSIGEFWRRWHMTLSHWFRDYVYIPLGGNRRGLLLQCRNLMIVWLLTGLWHGAGWNFILWGLYFAVWLILERFFLKRILERTPKLLRHLYTLVLVFISFLIFSSDSLAFVWDCLRGMIGIGTVGFSVPILSYRLLRSLPLLAVAGVGATPLVRTRVRIFLQKGGFRGVLIPIGSALILVICTAYLADSTYSPFAYFNF